MLMGDVGMVFRNRITRSVFGGREVDTVLPLEFLSKVDILDIGRL